MQGANKLSVETVARKYLGLCFLYNIWEFEIYFKTNKQFSITMKVCSGLAKGAADQVEFVLWIPDTIYRIKGAFGRISGQMFTLNLVQ